MGNKLDWGKIAGRVNNFNKGMSNLNVAQNTSLRNEQAYNDGLNYSLPIDTVPDTNKGFYGSKFSRSNSDALFGKTFAPNKISPLAENKQAMVNQNNYQNNTMFNQGARDSDRVKTLVNQLFGK